MLARLYIAPGHGSVGSSMTVEDSMKQILFAVVVSLLIGMGIGAGGTFVMIGQAHADSP
jgi:hypothetical protein